MEISFVIPAYNEEKYIGKCLDSVFGEIKKDPEIEVIVADNGSTDRTREIVARYPKAKLVVESKKGANSARQAGFLAAKGDLIAGVDADTMLTPGWIKKIRKEFAKDPKLVCLSGHFLYYDIPKRARILVNSFYALAFLTYLVNRFVLRRASLVQGGNYVIKKSALQKIGGYDTNLEFYGDDADLAYRLNKVGKVRFTFALPIYSSGRRLMAEGIFTMGVRYAVNYLSMVFFRKTASKKSIEIRNSPDESRQTYSPKGRIREWTIAFAAITVLLGVLSGIVFLGYTVINSGFFGYFSISQIKAETKKMSDKINTISGDIGRSIRIKTNGIAK